MTTLNRLSMQVYGFFEEIKTVTRFIENYNKQAASVYEAQKAGDPKASLTMDCYKAVEALYGHLMAHSVIYPTLTDFSAIINPALGRIAVVDSKTDRELAIIQAETVHELADLPEPEELKVTKPVPVMHTFKKGDRVVAKAGTFREDLFGDGPYVGTVTKAEVDFVKVKFLHGTHNMYPNAITLYSEPITVAAGDVSDLPTGHPGTANPMAEYPATCEVPFAYRGSCNPLTNSFMSEL